MKYRYILKDVICICLAIRNPYTSHEEWHIIRILDWHNFLLLYHSCLGPFLYNINDFTAHLIELCIIGFQIPFKIYDSVGNSVTWLSGPIWFPSVCNIT